MAIKNCAEVGENMMRIVKRLMANQNLLKMLYYTDKDPLSQPDISEDIVRKEIYQKLIKIVPILDPTETAKSVISIVTRKGTMNEENDQFRDIQIRIEIFVPNTQWFIKSDNLRPFIIMGEIQKSLEGKSINGMGRIIGGDYALNFIADDIICYVQDYYLIAYD